MIKNVLVAYTIKEAKHYMKRLCFDPDNTILIGTNDDGYEEKLRGFEIAYVKYVGQYYLGWFYNDIREFLDICTGQNFKW